MVNDNKSRRWMIMKQCVSKICSPLKQFLWPSTQDSRSEEGSQCWTAQVLSDDEDPRFTTQSWVDCDHLHWSQCRAMSMSDQSIVLWCPVTLSMIFFTPNINWLLFFVGLQLEIEYEQLRCFGLKEKEVSLQRMMIWLDGRFPGIFFKKALQCFRQKMLFSRRKNHLEEA